MLLRGIYGGINSDISALEHSEFTLQSCRPGAHSQLPHGHEVMPSWPLQNVILWSAAVKTEHSLITFCSPANNRMFSRFWGTNTSIMMYTNTNGSKWVSSYRKVSFYFQTTYFKKKKKLDVWALNIYNDSIKSNNWESLKSEIKPLTLHKYQ